MEWPIFYANRQFSHTFGMDIRPPERLSGPACAAGPELLQSRTATELGSQVKLWDMLQLVGKSEQQLMDELRESWKHMGCGIFALHATMLAPKTGSFPIVQDASTQCVPVSCRF